MVLQALVRSDSDEFRSSSTVAKCPEETDRQNLNHIERTDKTLIT